MDFLILTGMSGAGKSAVLDMLEDIGYFCIDNVVPPLIEKIEDFFSSVKSSIKKVAIVVDIRGGEFFDDFLPWLDKKDGAAHFKFSILFLDCASDVLLKRYKETRRIHPLSKQKSLAEGIEQERKILLEIKNRATFVIDTSNLLQRHLKEYINSTFSENRGDSHLIIRLISFGYKYGIPLDCDLMFDMRFLQNPFYISELKDLTGNDDLVYNYVLASVGADVFLEKLASLLDFLIPAYVDEGKNQLVIAFGCTGGQHRSVSMVNYFKKYFENAKYKTIELHRDIKTNR